MFLNNQWDSETTNSQNLKFSAGMVKTRLTQERASNMRDQDNLISRPFGDRANRNKTEFDLNQ